MAGSWDHSTTEYEHEPYSGNNCNNEDQKSEYGVCFCSHSIGFVRSFKLLLGNQSVFHPPHDKLGRTTTTGSFKHVFTMIVNRVNA